MGHADVDSQVISLKSRHKIPILMHPGKRLVNWTHWANFCTTPVIYWETRNIISTLPRESISVLFRILTDVRGLWKVAY